MQSSFDMKIGLIIVLLCFTGAFAYPRISENAEECTEDNCNGPDCRCSSTNSPLTEGEAPQLIAITIDESVVGLSYENNWKPLLIGRKNPDGAQISATFYVPHEYTDYSLVQSLYVDGFEIGVNSISRNSSEHYWDSADLDTLTNEFSGQRTIISNFAVIPIEDIRGARTPQFKLAGDVSINAYTESGILYDNSWPTRSSLMLYPYTLDYASTQDSAGFMVPPREPHPGFWIAPITDIRGPDGVECNNLITCNINGTAEEISSWLLSEVNRVRTSPKTPISILITSGWFEFIENSYQGFEQFLDQLGSLNDVFLVSQKQVIDWVKSPVSVENFKTETSNRTANCDKPVNCELYNLEGNIRYMTTCATCPEVYPWVGNPLGIDPSRTTQSS